MKKLVFLLFGIIFTTTISAQVFNTASTLKAQKLSMGIEPVVIAEGDNTMVVFGHIGFGLTKNIDLSGKIGFLNDYQYLGADVEFALNKNFSVAGGVHSTTDFGFDGTFLGSFNINKNVVLYGGVDADINFTDEMTIPIWVPVGVEIFFKKKLAFILEGSVAVTDDAYNLLGGGVNYYF